MRCLIAYDIADSRRLQRIQRYMQQYARALQRSVYLFEGNASVLARCLDGVKQRINPDCDDVRVYAISQSTRLLHAGRLPSVDGVWLDSDVI